MIFANEDELEACYGLFEAMRLVGQFNDKLQICPTQRITDEKTEIEVSQEIFDASAVLGNIANSFESMLQDFAHDERVARTQLMVEELSELLQGLAERDEVKVLDALADLLYVVLGSAVTFDMPLDEAFLEAHRSNMTKEKQEDDVSKARVRKKGKNYVPADFKRVLEHYRRSKG